MNYYYWFNREKLLKKAHGKYHNYHNKDGKEKTVLYYQKNKEDQK